jgi:ATP-dependent DNA ligase
MQRYFAFDLLHVDGHDLRRYPRIQRRAVLSELIRSAGCPRLVYVDHARRAAIDCSMQSKSTRSAGRL